MPADFAWYELNTTDTQAAQRFYTSLIGWGLQAYEVAGTPPGGDAYVMWLQGGRPIGGVMRLPEEAKKKGARPAWLAYVGVPDVDAAVRKATGLGAHVIVPPTDIPGGGRFAVLTDPQGAMFGVVGGDQPPEAAKAGGPSVGDFSWHELATTDVEAAVGFYSAMFGWQKLTANDMGDMGVYQEYGFPGRSLGGIYKILPDMPAPPHWMLYVMVADLDKAVADVKAAGGQVMHGPAEVPGGDRIAMCLDPQSAAFALHQKKG